MKKKIARAAQLILAVLLVAPLSARRVRNEAERKA